MDGFGRSGRRQAVLIWALAGAAAVCSGSAAAEAAAPVDPRVVLERLYGRSVAEGDAAALILFIARYPEEPLAGEARLRLRAMRAPDPAPTAGPDGRIIAEFDAARLAGPAALDAFAVRHAGHPLAAEARRPFWRGAAP